MRREDKKPHPKPAGAKPPPRPPRLTAGPGQGGDDEVYRVTMIKHVILGVLAQAQRENATDVVMGPATDGGTAIRYKAGGTWLNWLPVGVGWPQIGPELAGLAGVRNTEYPKEGIIYVAYSGVRLWWQANMTNHDECILHNIGKGNV